MMRFLFFISLAVLSGCSSLPKSQPLSYLDASQAKKIRLTEVVGQTRELTEKTKINYLLDLIGASELTFIRNGKEYSGTNAARWLRWKMMHAQFRQDPIDTAEKFVSRVAVRSNKTGIPYKVRFADGRVENLMPVLENELRTLNEALRHQRGILAPEEMAALTAPEVKPAPALAAVFIPATVLSERK